MEAKDVAVERNQAAGRFEVRLGEQVAFLQYRISGQRILLIHTEVPRELEGRGLGSKLARAALDYARSAGLRVVPRCPFVAEYISRHPEYGDLLPPEAE